MTILKIGYQVLTAKFSQFVQFFTFCSNVIFLTQMEGRGTSLRNGGSPGSGREAAHASASGVSSSSGAPQGPVLHFFTKLRRHASLEGASPYLKIKRWKLDSSQRASSLDTRGEIHKAQLTLQFHCSGTYTVFRNPFCIMNISRNGFSRNGCSGNVTEGIKGMAFIRMAVLFLSYNVSWCWTSR